MSSSLWAGSPPCSAAASAAPLELAARAAVAPACPPQWLSRLGDYAALTKPRIAVLALASVAVGYSVGCRGEFTAAGLCHALLGIGAIAAGCSVLNQWLERDIDARMRRTAGRPLPAGRVRPSEALALGCGLSCGGFVWLLAQVNPLTAWLTLATLICYVGVYTPLKRWTPLCTAIGAIPGAAPPLLGWTAAGGSLDAAALALFGILFLWQFPHFLAIAWIYRDDYAQGGLRMLPRGGCSRTVGWLAVGYAVALIPVSLLPRFCGLAGDAYFATALVLGSGYLLGAAAFAWDPTRATARRLLWTSLIYLPTLLASLTIDHWRLLS